ncbi:MAG: hypothetical protein ABR540_20775 [Acidimicrobiales bacterium]
MPDLPFRRKRPPPSPVDPRQLRAAIEAADEAAWAGLGFRRRTKGIYEQELDEDIILVVVDMLTDEDPPERSDTAFGVHWVTLERQLADALGFAYNRRSSSVMARLLKLAPRPVTLRLEGAPRRPEDAIVEAATARAGAVLALGRPWFDTTANPAGVHCALHDTARLASEAWLDDVARLALACQLNAHEESVAELAKALVRRADERGDKAERFRHFAQRLQGTR